MNLIIPKNIRPTTNKLKAAIFNILYSELGGDYSELIFFDIFAGSGAIGIEALQKNFKKAIFIEKVSANLQAIKENLKKKRIPQERFELIKKDVLADQSLKELEIRTIKPGVIFLDPPYQIEFKLIFKLLKQLPQRALLILERKFDSAEEKFWSEEQEDFRLKKVKKYGDSCLFFFDSIG